MRRTGTSPHSIPPLVVQERALRRARGSAGGSCSVADFGTGQSLRRAVLRLAGALVLAVGNTAAGIDEGEEWEGKKKEGSEGTRVN